MSDRLLRLLVERDRLDAEICAEAGSFDASGDWAADGSVSMQAWLRARARMTHRQAAGLVARARKLRVLPLTLAEWQAGSLSGGQVEAIMANVGRRVSEFDEEALLPVLRSLSVDDTVRAMQHWRQRVDALGPLPEAELDVPGRLHLSPTLDGRGALDADLDTETYELLKTALRVADDGDLSRDASVRRHDAMGTVCQFFLDNQTEHRGGRHRPHLNVLVDLETMTGHYVDGAELSRQTIERYCCDSAMHRLLREGRSTILDLGTSTRVLTAALWVALVARDEHCRFGTCDRPATWCDGHHVHWFSRGGPTRLDNLVLLCRRHHTLLHEPGWHAKLLPDGTFDVTTPDGRVLASHPPGALVPP